jgi:hypothetical protein
MLAALPAEGRRYPITKSDASGTWVGTKRGLVHGQGELWKRYGVKEGLPSARITDLALSTRSVWVATDRGLARLDKGSRRWELFKTPQLPTLKVTAVSVDPSDSDQIWVGTAAGVAHYHVRKNAWRTFGVRSGLPSARVNDVLFRGRTVWAATDGGLAAFDVKLGTWSVYTTKQGLAGGKVLEIDEQGTDLWLTSELGLSRMNLQRRTFSPFRRKEGLPSTTFLAQARAQNLIYFVTDKGLITYDTTADALGPFLHAKGLQGAEVRAAASAGGFIWFATAKGLSRFDPTKKVWEYYTVEDGLSTDDLSQLTVAGSFLVVLGKAGEVDTYDYKKDEWVERTGLLPKVATAGEGGASSQPSSQPASGPSSQPAGEGEDEGLKLSFSAELNTELKQEFFDPPDDNGKSREGYWLVNTLRLGMGAQWGGGRSVDVSGNLDWGDLNDIFEGDYDTLKSFQRYDLRIRYLGRSNDWLREVILSDELRFEPDGGKLIERTEVEGGRVVVGLGPKRRGGKFATLQVTGGIRRGKPMRVVIKRPTVTSLQIKKFELFRDRTGKGAIIPSSVRATLDGKELERNVDYFIDHENGVLWIKNTDLAHAMRTLEVEFEYEQIPRKSLGAVSLTDLLPRDGDIGQIKRAGQSRWAKDEQGLFDEIDGGAEQYINRGWQKTLSQDFEWGSAGVTLRIHDMGDEKNAKSIFLARKAPDAKQVPGLKDVFLERQSSSLTVKLVNKRFYIEISIDQPSMEQEILSVAGWLTIKLSAEGSTSADDLRDAIFASMASFRFTDNFTVGLSYVGARTIDDAEVKQRYGVKGRLGDLFALHAAYSRRLSQSTRLTARFQAAASNSQEEGQERTVGNGVLGEALLTSPKVVVRAAARRYSKEYGGLGVARQTEFCRTKSGTCRAAGTSRMEYEVDMGATVKPLEWLPVELFWQRQSALLGQDYADAPSDRPRVGVRDVALGQVGLDYGAWPKLTLGGGYIRRNDALNEQGQARATAAMEADLAEGLLSSLKFKKLYLRGLYEYGNNGVDEFRTQAAEERDRAETMHHAVGELKVAPTLTESGYATFEYHGLQGVLDADGTVADALTYWRLDTGAGSSIIPGLAARFDSTLWFGDDPPFTNPDPAAGAITQTERRTQEASSQLSGVLDIFPGEWLKALSPLKMNVAYTYTRDSKSEGRGRGPTYPLTREICDNNKDDDGDGDVDCADDECSADDACLVISDRREGHRVYGTLYWDTPGKLQAEVFADMRWDYAERITPASEVEQIPRSVKQEMRTYVTWRPIQPSPITARFDLQRETKWPEKFDARAPEGNWETLNIEPAVEWRRRWSPKWWHLAKLTVSYAQHWDAAHVVPQHASEAGGRLRNEVERQDYSELSLKPSLEIRRRFEDPDGIWNLRPYVRSSYAYKWGKGRSSRTATGICMPGDACFADGSESGGVLSVSLGLLWVHSENLFVDLDLNTSYQHCSYAKTDATCSNKVAFTPHLLATVRY